MGCQLSIDDTTPPPYPNPSYVQLTVQPNNIVTNNIEPLPKLNCEWPSSENTCLSKHTKIMEALAHLTNEETQKKLEYMSIYCNRPKDTCLEEYSKLRNLVPAQVSKFPFAGYHFVKFISNYDADTVTVLFHEHKGFQFNLRINGVDSPELRSKVPVIKQHAITAKEFVSGLLVKGEIYIANFHCWDKYGGRIVADLFINDESLADMLIERKLAVKYDGNTKLTDTDWVNFIESIDDEFVELDANITTEKETTDLAA